MRAQAEAMQAVIALAAGDTGRCREHLGAALAAARDWVELPPLATAIDACAAYVLDVSGDAEIAATLLGAAHSIRGAFNESSLVAPGVREAARLALGAAGFDDAYRRGRELGKASGGRVRGRSGAPPVGGDRERGEHQRRCRPPTAASAPPAVAAGPPMSSARSASVR